MGIVAKGPLRRRSWSWVLWIVALGVGAFFIRRSIKNRPVKLLDVRVQRVERGQVRDLVSTVAAGRVAGVREATLRAEIAGTVRGRSSPNTGIRAPCASSPGLRHRRQATA